MATGYVPRYSYSVLRGTRDDIIEQNKYLDSIRKVVYLQPKQPLFGVVQPRLEHVNLRGSVITFPN